MADAIISQIPVEVVVKSVSNIRLSQSVIEVVIDPDKYQRTSQLVVEIVRENMESVAPLPKMVVMSRRSRVSGKERVRSRGMS